MRTLSTVSSPVPGPLASPVSGQSPLPANSATPFTIESRTRPTRLMTSPRETWPKRVALALATTTLSLVLAACGNAPQVQPAGKLLPSTNSPTPAIKGGAPAPLTTPADSYAIEAVKRAGPAVVRVSNTGHGIGSGVLIDSRGYIVTNNHVVEGGTRFRITLGDGKQLAAQLVGTDPADDLAVLKIAGTNLPSITLGDSSALEVGQSVLAIGTPLGFSHTVTEGIISALSRTVSEGNGAAISGAIQTSAPINPGNSGGALVDLQGQLVGIPTLTAIDPEFNIPANGVGFAIPVSRVKQIVPQLIASGSVQHTGRPLLGVVLAGVDSQVQQDNNLSVDHGVLIEKVTPGGAAQQDGLQAGDVITALDGQAVASTQDLQQILTTKQPGQQIRVSFIRGSHAQEVTLTLGEVPAQ